MIFSNRKEIVRNVHDCLVGYIYTLKKLTTDLPRNGKIMNVCYDNVNSMCFIYINGNKQMQWCFEIKFKFKHVLAGTCSLLQSNIYIYCMIM